jgi:hypothetical protein
LVVGSTPLVPPELEEVTSQHDVGLATDLARVVHANQREGI